MKTSLEHLLAVKQEELREIVSLICSKLKPEFIILFGSYARGDWVEDVYQENGITYEYTSDFDLLVVMEDPKKVNYATPWRKVEDRLTEWSKIQTPVSIIRHDIQSLNKELSKGRYFYCDIRKEGILLYSSKRFELAKSVELNTKTRLSEAERYFKIWYQQAVNFRVPFKACFDAGDFKTAVFQLHQYAESLYTTILLVFTGYRPKSHDLERLESLADSQYTGVKSIFPKFTDEQQNLFNLLNSAYVGARYDEKYQITKEELEYLAERVEKLKELTEKICNKKIVKLQIDANKKC